MTLMQATECKSYSVHRCHWPVVNDTNTWAGARQVLMGPFRECHWPVVNDTNADCWVYFTLIISTWVWFRYGGWRGECDLDTAKKCRVWFTLSAKVSLTVSLTGFILSCCSITLMLISLLQHVVVACCSIVIGVQTPAAKEEDDHYETSHGCFRSMLYSLRFKYSVLWRQWRTDI